MNARQRRQEEQDLAAGGADLRKLRLEDGQVVTASVTARKFPKGYQLWGYLQFKAKGRTKTKYIGRATAPTRAESLKLLWALVRKHKVAEAAGWTWESKPKKGA